MKKMYICPVTEEIVASPAAICAGSIDTSRYYRDPETGEWVPIKNDDEEEPEGDGTLGKHFDVWDDWN